MNYLYVRLTNVRKSTNFKSVNHDVGFFDYNTTPVQWRPVARKGAGRTSAPPVFGRSFNPISTRGHIIPTQAPPGFSDLATALQCLLFCLERKGYICTFSF